MLPPHLELLYPKLKSDGGKKTSEADPQYNCLSWSAKRTTKFRYEPKPIEKWEKWPSDIIDDYSLESFIILFERLGYRRCSNLDCSLEFFWKKVAIYAVEETIVTTKWEFTHVSDQLNSGAWTSKLGYREDIQHDTPHSLEGDFGDEYGQVYQVLKRPCSPWELIARLYFLIRRIF